MKDNKRRLKQPDSQMSSAGHGPPRNAGPEQSGTDRRETRTTGEHPPGTARCPICGENFARHESSTYPFCSARCRKIDLGRWLDGNYRISRPIERRDLDEE